VTGFTLVNSATLKTTRIRFNCLLLLFISLFGHSRELVIYSSDAPPHMIAANSSGIDIDIVKTILNEMGHQVEIRFAPLSRAKQQVKKHNADVFLPTFFQKDDDNIFISNAFINYRPMVFTLNESQLTINNFTDLKDKRVLSFQGAGGYFGKAFRQATMHSGYTELHDMAKFPELLLMKRYDVVVLDYFIFYYFLNKRQEEVEQINDHTIMLNDNYTALIKRHDIMPRVEAYVGFNDVTLRNKFNQKLKMFLENKRHERIIEKYIGIVNSKILVLKKQIS
jgi:ABC-type amino acid transport substrate-binding protein